MHTFSVIIAFVTTTFATRLAPGYYKSLKPLTTRPKAVLDMDDVLYPKSSNLRTSLIDSIAGYTGEILSYPLEEAKELAAQYNREHGLIIRGPLIKDRIVPGEYEKYLDDNVDYGRIKRDEELIKLLGTFKADIVIFTNAGWVHTRRTLKILGILELCHLIVFTDYQERNFPAKPDEEAYARVERLLGDVDPSMIYFADDNLKNVQAALRRNWNAIQIAEDSSVAVMPSIKSINSIHSITREFPILLDE